MLKSVSSVSSVAISGVRLTGRLEDVSEVSIAVSVLVEGVLRLQSLAAGAAEAPDAGLRTRSRASGQHRPHHEWSSTEFRRGSGSMDRSRAAGT
jgi:hypothetical protein